MSSINSVNLNQEQLVPFLAKARYQLMQRQEQLRRSAAISTAIKTAPPSVSEVSPLLMATAIKLYCCQHNLDTLALCYWLDIDLFLLLQLETYSIVRTNPKVVNSELHRLATNFGIEYEKLEVIVREFV
jgi:hypothetical protein